MYGLGRNVSPFDRRDYPLSAFIRRTTDVTEKLWAFEVDALNQLDTPHCGGFTMAHYGICHPMPSIYTNKDGHNFYYRCKETEGEPGLENGTSCRAMAQTGKKLGMWSTYAFAQTVDEAIYWILNEGPIMFGTVWTNDMFFPDKDGFIHCTGDDAGGHAYLGLGATLIDDYLWGLTTWGPDFGINGKFKIPLSEFRKLFARQGEAIAAVEVAKVDPSVQSGCRNTPIGKALARMLG